MSALFAAVLENRHCNSNQFHGKANLHKGKLAPAQLRNDTTIIDAAA